MRGGARKGSGRKPGSGNRNSAKIAYELVEKSKVTPLEIIVEAMIHHYELYRTSKGKDEEALAEAVSFAERAAPYMHPRLQAVQHSGEVKQTQPPNLVINFTQPKKKDD
jgi:hypothetical protein